MKTQTMPNMIVFQTGEQFKVLKVSGTKGMEMPSHLSIKEAVVIILKSEAVLKLTNKEIHLRKRIDNNTCQRTTYINDKRRFRSQCNYGN